MHDMLCLMPYVDKSLVIAPHITLWQKELYYIQVRRKGGGGGGSEGQILYTFYTSTI